MPTCRQGRNTLHEKQTSPMRIVSVRVEEPGGMLSRRYMIEVMESRNISSGMRCFVVDARLMTEQNSAMVVQQEARVPPGWISWGSIVDVGSPTRYDLKGGEGRLELSWKKIGGDPEYRARPRSHLSHMSATQAKITIKRCNH